MNRNSIKSAVAAFTFAAAVIGLAAYAPHSEALSKLSRENASIAPCAGGFQSADLSGPKYPVPSPDLIARGHSGN
jgi:hypothetical protein